MNKPTEHEKQIARPELNHFQCTVCGRIKSYPYALAGPTRPMCNYAHTLPAEMRQVYVTAANQQRNEELEQAKELLREIRDGEVNAEDEADKFLRDHVLSELSRLRGQLTQRNEDMTRLRERVAKAEKWLWVFAQGGEGESLYNALERQYGTRYEVAYGWERRGSVSESDAAMSSPSVTPEDSSSTK